MKEILILGGTQFVGRHLSESLLAESKLQVTLFHRGRTHPQLFPEYRHLLGDRETDSIRQVLRRDWDAVIDFSGYYPQSLSALAQALTGRVGRYLYISSISAYDFEQLPEDTVWTESGPTLPCTPEQAEDRSMFSYGERKAACERALLALPELNSVVFRPGLIYGPYDPTDRFYYWLWRTRHAETMLVPADLSVPFQWTYALDFAAILRQALLGEQPKESVYQVLTHAPLAFGEMLTRLEEQAQRTVRRVPISPRQMEEHDVKWWQDLPLTTPSPRLFDRSRYQRDFQSPETPFVATLETTWRWYAQQGWPTPKTGLDVEQERILLSKLGIY
jgi:2'-hydroxyisoflavone reductase